ncbi:ERI1 exoribonuclease 2 [Megalops cyprinoides]|uniref:ERI1 exoribonuclease 2 n=1 Tax=Megalops cyprinoides TaxID=118141 RepID=UPI0018655002|nr:ERI1 exoribonuclease 2 [Megalops cyprinoides]
MATKKLAKELGLVRKRSRPADENLAKPTGSRQFFSYLIVIDFESTCWKEKNSYGQEIIEFPAVLLNTSNGKIDSEFHTYVQPQEHPILSEFCTELTGIRQTQVEAGVPLQICLSRFTRWLQTLRQEKNIVFVNEKVCAATAHPCAFVTWSDWDLGVCLQYECKRKQISKPDILNSWIDLRATYRLFYNRKPKGLNGALQDLGLEFSGREHSGLDDARNTAHLAWRMITDGCLMKVTRSLNREPPRTNPLFINTQMKPDPGNVGANETGGGSKKHDMKQLKPGSHEKEAHSSKMSLSSRGGIKVTSPLCSCGRRAKRLTVANGGPNHGRVFYSCPIGRTGSGNKKSCGFFKWESVLVKDKSTSKASTSLCFVPGAGCLSSGKSFSNKSLCIPPPKNFVLRRL